jgi:hypothetical protein
MAYSAASRVRIPSSSALRKQLVWGRLLEFRVGRVVLASPDHDVVELLHGGGILTANAVEAAGRAR